MPATAVAPSFDRYVNACHWPDRSPLPGELVELLQRPKIPPPGSEEAWLDGPKAPRILRAHRFRSSSLGSLLTALCFVLGLLLGAACVVSTGLLSINMASDQDDVLVTGDIKSEPELLTLRNVVVLLWTVAVCCCVSYEVSRRWWNKNVPSKPEESTNTALSIMC